MVIVVFQSKLDYLGMVIYASELTLWIGVFACGGYFNFTPWIRQKVESHRSIASRVSPTIGDVDGDHAITSGRENDITLQRMPSSSSVFRTPSLVTRQSEAT